MNIEQGFDRIIIVIGSLIFGFIFFMAMTAPPENAITIIGVGSVVSLILCFSLKLIIMILFWIVAGFTGKKYYFQTDGEK